MTWSTLEANARHLGFEVAFNTKQYDSGGFTPDLTPPKGSEWQLIGNYARIAGFWVKPCTDKARRLSCHEVEKLMLDSDPFVEPPEMIDIDAIRASGRFLLALQNQELVGMF